VRRLVVFALIWVGACGSQPAIVTPAPLPRPAEPALKQPAATLFGVVLDGVFKRQSRINLVEDTVYGWRIKLPCTGPTPFRETLQLPNPREWTIDPDVTKHIKVSSDRRRAVTDDYSGCYDGWIQHTWTIGADDPAGEYVLSVEVDGYQPQTFRSRFVPEDGDDGPGRRRLRD
jgi:hypothetical protein